jgi:DNA-directed RNA polymerase alpha subunit
MDEQMTKLNNRVTDLHEAYRVLLQSVNNLRKEMGDYCTDYEINSVKETIKTDQERVNLIEEKINEQQAQIIKLEYQLQNLRTVKKPRSFNYRRNFKINDPLIQQYRVVVKKLPYVLANCLELDVRTCNIFALIRIETIGNLLNWSREDLLNVKNCGVKTVDQIEEVLSEFNLRLRRDDENNL